MAAVTLLSFCRVAVSDGIRISPLGTSRGKWQLSFWENDRNARQANNKIQVFMSIDFMGYFFGANVTTVFAS